MLSLKSSARDSKRYLRIKGVRSAVEEAILEYIGVLGWANAAPVFVSERGNQVVVAVNREALSNVRAALALAKDELTILRVSGTLKGLDK
ncbi:hypothetical protein J4416_01395 [Candidatus Pacearchaeota archaeon]|nr:hypothetical protein [Candidatus Pacearchaeota archaeon]